MYATQTLRNERLASHDFILGPGQEPRLGSHLVTPRGLYRHHGIYVGNGRVIHYSGLTRGLRRGPVEDVSLEQFAHGREIRVRPELQLFDCCEVVKRARSRLGEQRYRILTNNCEHFCTWAMRGDSPRHLAQPSALLRTLYQAICGLWPSSEADVRWQERGLR